MLKFLEKLLERLSKRHLLSKKILLWESLEETARDLLAASNVYDKPEYVVVGKHAWRKLAMVIDAIDRTKGQLKSEEET